MAIVRCAVATNSSAGPSTLRPATTEIVYQRFAIEPQDQTAVIGSRVTLPCRVLDQKGPIQWTKDDFGLGAVRNLTGYERYAMIGSDEEGNPLYNNIIIFINPIRLHKKTVKTI